MTVGKSYEFTGAAGRRIRISVSKIQREHFGYQGWRLQLEKNGRIVAKTVIHDEYGALSWFAAWVNDEKRRIHELGLGGYSEEKNQERDQ